MSELAYLKKVVRVRKYLIDTNRSQKPYGETVIALKKFDAWLKFYKGKAKDSGARAMILNHTADVLKIIPGANCTMHNKLMSELNLILNK